MTKIPPCHFIQIQHVATNKSDSCLFLNKMRVLYVLITIHFVVHFKAGPKYQ